MVFLNSVEAVRLLFDRFDCFDSYGCFGFVAIVELYDRYGSLECCFGCGWEFMELCDVRSSFLKLLLVKDFFDVLFI